MSQRALTSHGTCDFYSLIHSLTQKVTGYLTWVKIFTRSIKEDKNANNTDIFHLDYSFLCCAKAFKFNQVPLLYFCFYFHYSRRWVTEDLALTYVIKCSAYVFLCFIVSGLTFRSLIHFEFIFVYGVRKCSNFILLHVAVQFSQHHFLKRPPLPHCIFLPLFVKNKVPIGAWVHLWFLCLVPLVYISVFVPVPYYLDDCSFIV